MEVESDVANWAQIFYKRDSEKQKYRQELTPNAEFKSINKIKVFKKGCEKHFTKLQKLKNTKSEIKPIQIGK